MGSESCDERSAEDTRCVQSITTDHIRDDVPSSREKADS